MIVRSFFCRKARRGGSSRIRPTGPELFLSELDEPLLIMRPLFFGMEGCLRFPTSFGLENIRHGIEVDELHSPKPTKPTTRKIRSKNFF